MPDASSHSPSPREFPDPRRAFRGSEKVPAAVCLAAVLCRAGSAQGDVERIDVSTAGVQANAGAEQPSVNFDGRFVVYASAATNLVAGGTSGRQHVYLRDRIASTTTLITQRLGLEANGDSGSPVLSADGRFVVFASSATNLVANDTNGARDIFLETLRTTTFGYCFGDATGIGCPCANAGEREKGCENSHGTGGALLVGLGTTSVSQDSFVLAASTLTPNTSVLFLQGTGQLANLFGDGLRCVGGTVLRLGGRTADAGGNRALGHGIAGDPSVSAAGQVPSAGGSRYYQAWYRNAAAFCGPTTFNFSNGLSVVWTP